MSSSAPASAAGSDSGESGPAEAGSAEAGPPLDADGMRTDISVFIATPAYGGVVHCGYLKSLLETQRALESQKIRYFLCMLESESLITRARNVACAVFLAGSWTHLIFIDSDIVWPVSAVAHVLNSGKSICGVPYPIKKLAHEKFAERIDPSMPKEIVSQLLLERYCLDFLDTIGVGEAYAPEFDSRGYCKVASLGTGFLMIRRDALVAMSRMCRQYVNDIPGYVKEYGEEINKYFYDFFDTMIDPDTKRYLSEDYAFCLKARRMNLDIWMFPFADLVHCGVYKFHGNLWSTYKFKDRKTDEYTRLIAERVNGNIVFQWMSESQIAAAKAAAEAAAAASAAASAAGTEPAASADKEDIP